MFEEMCKLLQNLNVIAEHFFTGCIHPFLIYLAVASCSLITALILHFPFL